MMSNRHARQHPDEKISPSMVRDQPFPGHLVEHLAVIGRKCKNFFDTRLGSGQWFLLLYLAGFGCLLILATLLKVAMKLI